MTYFDAIFYQKLDLLISKMLHWTWFWKTSNCIMHLIRLGENIAVTSTILNIWRFFRHFCNWRRIILWLKDFTAFFQIIWEYWIDNLFLEDIEKVLLLNFLQISHDMSTHFPCWPFFLLVHLILSMWPFRGHSRFFNMWTKIERKIYTQNKMYVETYQASIPGM